MILAIARRFYGRCKRGETALTKSDLGTKRTCTDCGARFYDLKRQPIICPKCGATHVPEQVVRPKRARTTPPKEAARSVPAAAAVEKVADDDLGDDVDDDVDDDDESLIEDASELGKDEDDVAEVLTNVDEPDGSEER